MSFKPRPTKIPYRPQPWLEFERFIEGLVRDKTIDEYIVESDGAFYDIEIRIGSVTKMGSVYRRALLESEDSEQMLIKAAHDILNKF